MQEPRDQQGYQVTIKMMNLLLNADSSTPDIIEHYDRFGGYAVGVTVEHITFLEELNARMVPISQAFDPVIIRRWKTVNELLINAYRPQPPNLQKLKFEFPGLAALVAFPLLEEVARRISSAWDEEGNSLIDVTASMGLFRTTQQGVRKPIIFKKGSRIIGLSQKLVIMKSFLSEQFQHTIDNLDRRMNVPRIQGATVDPRTFFERIEGLRNLWLHGREFEGFEAWLITHFLAMLYFRIPQDAEDAQFAESLAKFEAQVRHAHEKDADSNSAMS